MRGASVQGRAGQARPGQARPGQARPGQGRARQPPPPPRERQFSFSQVFFFFMRSLPKGVCLFVSACACPLLAPSSLSSCVRRLSFSPPLVLLSQIVYYCVRDTREMRHARAGG